MTGQADARSGQYPSKLPIKKVLKPFKLQLFRYFGLFENPLKTFETTTIQIRF